MKSSVYLGCLLTLISFQASAQLPQNFSYGRYLTQVEDQLRQGPCESFAAVGGVEAYYNLLYSGPSAVNPVNLSEREVYSCGGNPTIGLSNALWYIGEHGVIPRSCFAMPSAQCIPELSDKGQNPIIYDENRNCIDAQKICSEKFRIRATYRALTTEMTSNNGIKKALLDYGPIMLSFDDGGAIHSSYHAYLLYGWQTQSGTTNWLLRDSWPCAAGNIADNINIAAIYQSNGDIYEAYAITSVIREKWNGSSWLTQSMTVKPFELEQGKQSTTIAPPSNQCLNQGQYSIASLPTGSNVTGWSLRASSAYPNYAQISNTGVLSGFGADVTVIASMRHSNNMLENITLNAGDVGVPHRIDKTNDMCVTSTQREFTLRLISEEMPGYSYTYTMDFPPSPDNSYYVTKGGSKVAYVVSKKTQAINYSTTVTVRKNNNPGCSSNVTINRYVISMPCSYY